MAPAPRCALPRNISRLHLAGSLFAALLVALPLTLQGQPSSMNSISFQGALNGTNDQPVVNGSYNLTFQFWNHPTSPAATNRVGSAVTVSNVPVANGIASAAVPVDVVVFHDGSTRYLGITVQGQNGGNELTPRVLVTAVPYSLTAGGLFAPNGAISGSDSTRQNPAFDVITYETPEVRGEDAPNWRNSGVDAKFYRGLSSNWQPNVGLGFAVGPGICSPELWMLNYPGNAFVLSAVDAGQRIANGRAVFSVKPNGELRGNWLTLTSAPIGTENILRVYGTNDQPLLIVSAAGTTSVKVLQITGGADLAEPFDVNTASGEATVEPGMVMVIDRESDGKLTACSHAYDTAVAGVISGANGLQPGMVMQAEGQVHAAGQHPVAMTGRVWCWVDASTEAGGAVRRGDLLTTSATLGHAMRVSDNARAPGAVIGKAMTELSAGRGLVLVLVNLQ